MVLKSSPTHPQLGRKCPELKNTPFKYHEGRHLIFYRPTEKGIEIVRVLHDAMDIPRHFK
ncbi:MAG: type II toxin-antitoxin system RelE/ParE family toxin [bacterium]